MFTSTSAVPSFSFSGAGFLGAYHLGAVKYLQESGLLSSFNPNHRRRRTKGQKLMGSSAGSLVAAAISAGVRVEDAMTVVSASADEALNAGPLQSLTPNFSLVDVGIPRVKKLFVDASAREGFSTDLDAFVKERVSGNVLVFLTDNAKFLRLQGYDSHAFVSEFGDFDHLISACILSSYVPFATGPLMPKAGDVVDTAAQVMATKPVHRFGKEGIEEVQPRRTWWDGGLAAMFPREMGDTDTVIVSPIAIHHHDRNIVICPKPEWSSSANKKFGFKFDDQITAAPSMSNALAAWRMILPAREVVYDEIFASAYDDARRVCKENLLVPG